MVFPDRCTVYVSFPLNSFTQGMKVLSSLSLTVFYITIWVFTTQIFSSGFVNFKKTNKISTLACILFHRLFFNTWSQCRESVYRLWVCFCLGALVSSHDPSMFVRVFIGKVVTETAVPLTWKPGDKTHEWTVTSSSPFYELCEVTYVTFEITLSFHLHKLKCFLCSSVIRLIVSDSI